MADPNEGAAALEAAYIAAFDMLETDGTPMHPAKGTLLDAVRAALSAYLDALPDHRLLRVRWIEGRWTPIAVGIPPPGLKEPEHGPH